MPQLLRLKESQFSFFCLCYILTMQLRLPLTTGYWCCAAPHERPTRSLLKGVLFLKLWCPSHPHSTNTMLPAARRSNVLPKGCRLFTLSSFTSELSSPVVRNDKPWHHTKANTYSSDPMTLSSCVTRNEKPHNTKIAHNFKAWQKPEKWIRKKS